MAIVGLADMAVAETRERMRAALAFDGVMQPVSGVLPAAIAALAASRDLICPLDCGSEAPWAKGLSIIAPLSLTGLVNHIHGRQVLHPPTPKMAPARQNMPDLADLKGQDTARRVLEIAAVGDHHLLMFGPPGAANPCGLHGLPVCYCS